MEDRKVTRREFMKSSGMAAGGAALASQERPEIRVGPVRHKAVTGKVKLGIIGVGARARGNIPWIEAFSDECELAAICDISQYQIDMSMKRMLKSKPKIYYDWREMIQHPGLDAVVLMTPHHVHLEQAVGCLQKGLHMFYAKPMAMNPSECAEIVRTWRYSGVTLCMEVQDMYSEKVRMTKEIIDSGELGNVKMVVWNEFRPDWGMKKTEPDMEPQLNWMYMKTLQGDSLVADSCYYFEQIQYFIGAKPKTAVALGGIHVYHDGRNTIDHAVVGVEYENGAKLSHNTCLYSRGDIGAYMIIGDKAQLRSVTKADVINAEFWIGHVHGHLSIEPRSRRDKNVREISIREAEETGRRPEGKESTKGINMMARQYREFFDCMRTGRLPLTNALTGLDAVLTAYACQQSIYTGEVIHIKDLDPGVPG